VVQQTKCKPTYQVDSFIVFIYLLGWSGTKSTITATIYRFIIASIHDRWWWLWSN
jgi:hypothetical protein